MPEISFIVIGYNVEKFIDKTLESILKVSSRDIEIIFVDDGSKDKTSKIVKRKLTLDNRLKYIYQENSGANSARITGYLNSSGNYITFIDGDDKINHSIIEEFLTEKKYKDYDIISYNFEFEYDDKENERNKKFENKVYENYDFLEAVLISKTPHYLWNKLYKKEFLKTMEFDKIPSITMGDDLAANVKMGLEKPKVLNIDEIYYYYCLRNNSVSQKFNEKYIEIIKALNYIEKSLEKADLKSEYDKMIDYQYFNMFYYYVVKSKYKKTDIHRYINNSWKKRRILVSKNNYIRRYLDEVTNLERLLFILYNINYNLGYYLSRIYLRLIRR